MKLKFIVPVALGAMLLASSCSDSFKAPNANVALTSEVDSLSYAYGATLSNDMKNVLKQSGFLKDEGSISYEYQMKIAAAKDDAEKAKLEAEQKQKMATLKTDNEKVITAFLAGFSKGANDSDDAQKANALGAIMGVQTVGMNKEQFLKYFLGPDTKATLNSSAVVAALSQGLNDQEFKMPNAQKFLESKSEQKQKDQANVNKLKGQKFMADNATKAGVKTLPNGIQYKVLKEGTSSVKPTEKSKVKVHYKGTLTDGKVFDSSEGRDPIEFQLDQVIKGWTEVLQEMPVGSKWEVVIPSDLAYGDQGSGTIAPGETLIFDIELLGVN